MNIIERFRNEKLVVHCGSEEKARLFIKICYKNGMEWRSGDVSNTFFYEYDKIAYRCDGYSSCLSYSSIRHYCKEGYEVITFEEFMEEYRKMKFTKSDLEVGMLVETKDGCKGIVCNREVADNYFIAFQSGAIDLRWFDDNLNKMSDDDDKIMKVYGLPLHETSIDDMLNVDYRVLIWERKEVKEVTMEEIEEIYGCKIKIVKG